MAKNFRKKSQSFGNHKIEGEGGRVFGPLSNNSQINKKTNQLIRDFGPPLK
jgi:hypothetical protein